MFTAGLLRIVAQIFLLLMVGAVLLAFTQHESGTFWLIVAVICLGLAISIRLKAKEVSIRAKVTIEEDERDRIRSKRR